MQIKNLYYLELDLLMRSVNRNRLQKMAEVTYITFLSI